MTLIAIATPRDGDIVREVRRALNALGILQLSEAAVVCRPISDVKLEVPDACADKVLMVLRNTGIGAIRV
jgi:hypothetical protein